MTNIFSTIISKIKSLSRIKIGLGIVAILVVGVIGHRIIAGRATTYQFVPVTRGSITESVSLTGSTTPAQTVSLTFGSGGVISHTYSALGKQVYAGQLLAELNTSDLIAQLHQAQANVVAQKAKLDGLKNGSRPEDIATSQATVDKAKQDLTNMYASINDASIDSYAKATDAVRQLDPLFSSADFHNPQLTYVSGDQQAQIDAGAERISVGAGFVTWQDQLPNTYQSNAGLEILLNNGVTHLADVRALLTNLSKTLDNSAGISNATLVTYKLAISSALAEINTATKNLNTIAQNIASQKLIVAQSQAQLDLKQAGSLATDISAQQAQVAQAQASVDSAYAKLQNAQIIAPISGTITQFDAKIGQQANSGTVLVSIMSDTGYEVDAGASETDVGKILVGDKLTMTLDAFPNETFTGSVFYIAPAQTNTQGVISYQTKVSFDKPDARLKSGFTANLTIATKQKDNVLILPQYAILQNDTGSFVETVENNAIKQNPITLGIQDQKGNVEIVSGVTEGEQVLNIGLKQ